MSKSIVANKPRGLGEGVPAVITENRLSIINEIPDNIYDIDKITTNIEFQAIPKIVPVLGESLFTPDVGHHSSVTIFNISQKFTSYIVNIYWFNPTRNLQGKKLIINPIRNESHEFIVIAYLDQYGNLQVRTR